MHANIDLRNIFFFFTEIHLGFEAESERATQWTDELSFKYEFSAHSRRMLMKVLILHCDVELKGLLIP